MIRIKKDRPGPPYAVLQIQFAINVHDIENLVTEWMLAGTDLPSSRKALLAEIEDAAGFLYGGEGVKLANEAKKNPEILKIAEAYVKAMLPNWYEF